MVEPSLAEIHEQLKELLEWKSNLFHSFESLSKQMDDIMWHHKIDDIADLEKIRFTGPPPSEYAYKLVREIEMKNNYSYGLSHQPEDRVVLYAYVFKPKNLDKNKYPLMVFPHGGIHGNFNTTSNAKLVRELIEQGYIIVAPEYRGSCGYGPVLWNLVDYWPTAIEDTYVARNWMLDNYKQVDPDRIGIMGYSMGGYHALMGVLTYPKAYTAAYAGVPVTDLMIRLSYRWGDSRAEMYSGGNVGDVNELRKRSPAWNVEKLEVPLLIHANTNDRDNYIVEQEALIAHLKAAGKKFEYKIYQDAPGGHFFEGLDTSLAREARLDVYRFFAKYLKPENPP